MPNMTRLFAYLQMTREKKGEIFFQMIGVQKYGEYVGQSGQMGAVISAVIFFMFF